MRVLLLQAPVSTMSAHSHLSPPLGLAYLAGRLRDDGHDVRLLDLNITGFNPERVRAALARFAPDLVGISSHTETYPNALALASLVKEYGAFIPVILGGPHASILPEDVLAEPNVDYVAIGEGEQTLSELVRALEGASDAPDIGHIPGLGYKALATPRLNAQRAPLDPALVGRPARDLLSLGFYEDAHNVLVARGGCPYRCPFCSASQMWEGRRRMRPIGHIIAEVEEVVAAYGAAHIFFVDDILTFDRQWVLELTDALEACDLGITWGCATRVDRVDPALLERMGRSGCSGIQYGVESGAQSILDSVKGIKKDVALRAVRSAVQNGIAVSCSFMIPFPDDTDQTLAETHAFMRILRDEGARLLISYTTPFPGTAFREKAPDLGLTILTEDWSLYDAKHVVMETRHLSASRIEAIATDIAMDLGMTCSV